MRYLICLLALLIWSFPQNSHAQGEVLGGDVGLACEALLCLSSGERPGECSRSLSRYFSISYDDWGDTLRARRNFLNQCPSASAEGMPSLVENIVNAAGQCSASVLNRVMRRSKVIIVCDDRRYWLPDEERCHKEVIYYIDNTMPGYCRAYDAHQYTWKVAAHYEGEVMNGGRWVD